MQAQIDRMRRKGKTMNARFGTFMLALGLVAGSGTTLILHPAFASAEAAMGGMKMSGKSSGDEQMNAAMASMMKTMDASKLTGNQDRDFMMLMIPHHASAVEMAKIELRLGMRPELKALSRDIIKSQDHEIGQMKAWLRLWYAKK